MEMLPEPMTPVAPQRYYHGGNNAFHNFANDYSHISDPNLRRRLALSDIDKVPLGLYHVRAVAVAGVGFFLDSYDIFAINLITSFLGIVFWSGPPEEARNGYGGNYGQLPSPVNLALKTSTSAGIIVGQLLFGWLADVFGRRRMYGIELGIIVLATLNCALASPSPSISSTGVLVFWRVVMGIGIGGDYPLSSVITSEFAPTRWRGAMMAAVFSMQGIGQLIAAIVALVVTVAFKNSLIGFQNAASCDYACIQSCDRSWRIIVGFGALPACFALYYRITIPETPRYTFDVAQDVEKADADIKSYYIQNKPGNAVSPTIRSRGKRSNTPSLNIPSASWPDVLSHFRAWANLKVLIGTTLSWFFLDLAYYGVGLNSTIVLQAIGYSSGPTLYHILYNNAVGMIILACAGSLPGYWVSVLTIDTIGRKPLQVFGFLVLTIIFCVLGFGHQHLNEPAMLALYIIAQFFFNWGPNTTTFIVPGECFPTRYRSTGHGLSAAMGKLGAILAQVISIPILTRGALDTLMKIFALFMACGTAVSLLIPETRGVTLEELAGELPTSFNAGRNGGLNHHPRPARRPRNPFGGGQPAGFAYPRVRAKKGAWAVRSPRMDIMSSPELLAAAQAGTRRKGGKRRETAKGRASYDGPPSTASTAGPPAAGSGSVRDEGEQMMLATPASVLPGWGAGWGRTDRGDASGRDNFPLQDVGNLLR